MKFLECIFIYSYAALARLRAGEGAIHAASYFMAFVILMHIDLVLSVVGGILHENLMLSFGRVGIIVTTLLVVAIIAGYFLYGGKGRRLIRGSEERIYEPISAWIGWGVILWTFFVPGLCILIYETLQRR